LMAALDMELIVPSRGEAFDGLCHRRTARVPSGDGLPRNAIASISQPGLRRKGEVIRHAQVTTA
jgi:molecular chaperone GrpE (heat shock protein)